MIGEWNLISSLLSQRSCLTSFEQKRDQGGEYWSPPSRACSEGRRSKVGTTYGSWSSNCRRYHARGQRCVGKYKCFFCGLDFLLPVDNRRKIYTLNMCAIRSRSRCPKADAVCRTIKIYGAIDKRAQLEPQLIWATPGRRGFKVSGSGNATSASASRARGGAAAGPSYSQVVPRASQPYTFSNTQLRTPVAPTPVAPTPTVPRLSAAEIAAQQEAQRKRQEEFDKARELSQILNNLDKVDDESRRNSLLDTLCSTEDVLSLPVHSNPPSVEGGELKVDLLKHQACAVWKIIGNTTDRRV